MDCIISFTTYNRYNSSTIRFWLKEEEIENSISRITPALVICDSNKFELIKAIKEKLNLNFEIYLTEKDKQTEIYEDILTVHDVILNTKEKTTFKK